LFKVQKRSYSCLTFRQSVCQTVTLTCEGDNMSMMYQPVHDSCGKALVAKYRVPLPKFKVGCHNHTCLFITLGNQAEQKLCSVLMKRHKTQLIQNDSFCFSESPHKPIQLSI